MLIEGAHRLQDRCGVLQRLPGPGGVLFGRLQRLGQLPGSFFQRGQGGLPGLQGVPVFALLFAQGCQRGEHAVQGGGAQCPVEPVPVRLKTLHLAVQGVRLGCQGDEFPVQAIDGGPPGNGPGGGRAAGNAVGLLLLLFLECLDEGRFLFRFEQGDACGLRLEERQFVPLGTLAFMYAHGDAAVDLGAGDLFEDRRPFVRGCLEKGREATLGKQHGAGEPVEIHAGGRFDPAGHPPDGRIQNFPGLGVGHLVLRGLQFTTRMLACPSLAPGTPELPGVRGKGHLGTAFAGLAGHDFVAALGHLVQPRRASVQGQADRIEDGRLARAGGPGDGKNAVRGVGRVGQVDLPLADQGVQILETDLQYAHAKSPYSARRSSSCSDESVSR